MTILKSNTFQAANTWQNQSRLPNSEIHWEINDATATNSSSNLHYHKANITSFLIRLACCFVQMFGNWVIIHTIYFDLHLLLLICVEGFHFLNVQSWSTNMWCLCFKSEIGKQPGNGPNKLMFNLNPLNKAYLVRKQCIGFSMTFKKRNILSPNYSFPNISKGWVVHAIKTCSLQKSGEIPGAF